MKKYLSILLCLVLVALSITAFADDGSSMEVTYSCDFTELTGTEGTWSNNNLDYNIDDIEVGSLYRSAESMFPVAVGADGIKATKPYYIYNKSLSGKYEISGSFKSGNNGRDNQLRFMLNYNKNTGTGGANNITVPFDGNGLQLLVSNYSPDGATKAYKIVLMKSSTTLDDTQKVEENYRFTEGNVVDFVLSYDYPNLTLTLSESEREKSETFTYDLSSYALASDLRTEGYFAINDQNTSDSGMYLRSLTVKEEIADSDVPEEDVERYETVFEENFEALAQSGAVYDIDSLGWSTYTAATNNDVSTSKATGQLELFKGMTPCGLTSSGAGIAVYDTNFGKFEASTYIRHYLTSFTRIWFNSEFLDTTNKSGFCFEFDKANAKIAFKYVDGGQTLTLDTDTSANLAFLGDKAYATYALSYDNGVVALKVYDENSSLMIDKAYNLSDICAENNVSSYNTTGQYAIEFSGGGFMDIRSIAIKASLEDIASNEKLKIVSASAPFGAYAVYGRNDNAKVLIGLNKPIDEILSARFVVGDNTQEFINDGDKLAAYIPKLSDGVYKAHAYITDKLDREVKIDSEYFLIGDDSFIPAGFTVDGAEVTSISDAFGKTVTASFDYSYSKDAVVIACLYDASGKLTDIKFANGDGSVVKVDVSVPANANGYTLKAFMCESFASSAPLSGTMELN